jgi:hypothetical protein
MEITQPDVPLRPGANWKSADLQFQKEVACRINKLKADVAERPFYFLAVAFVAGFASNTLPARILFRVIVRLVSWLLGPALLVMGVIKVSDLFSSSPGHELTVLQEP